MGVAQISPEVLPAILSLDLFSIFLLVTISLGLLDQVVTAFACGEIRKNSAIYFENLYLGDIHSTPQPTKANSAISKPFREKISVDPLCFRVLEPSKSTQLLLLLIFGLSCNVYFFLYLITLPFLSFFFYFFLLFSSFYFVTFFSFVFVYSLCLSLCCFIVFK